MPTKSDTVAIEQRLTAKINNLTAIMKQIDQQLLDLQPAKANLQAQLLLFKEEEPTQEVQLEFEFSE